MIHFTITAPVGSLNTTPIGRLPQGYRLQVAYNNTVTFAGTTSVGKKVRGKVLTGNDWVLLRDDGVAVFDAKLTFGTTRPDGHVFGAVMHGRVPLDSIGWRAPVMTPDEWKALGGNDDKGQDLDVVLPIEFETSGPPPHAASEEVKKTARHWKTFVDLAKNEFAATGKIRVIRGQIVGAKLEVQSVGSRASVHGARSRRAGAQPVAAPAQELGPAGQRAAHHNGARVSQLYSLDEDVKSLRDADEGIWESLRAKYTKIQEITRLSKTLRQMSVKVNKARLQEVLGAPWAKSTEAFLEDLRKKLADPKRAMAGG